MQKVKKVQLRNYAAAFAVVGLAISPVAAGAVTDTTTVSATVSSTISMSTDGAVNVSLTPTATGVVSSAADTVLVSTNNTAGYILTLANNDATTSLQSGANSIAAHSGTLASPTTLANNTWGYAVAGAGGFGATYSAENSNGTSTSTWAGVPSSAAPVTLKSTSSTATNDSTEVWYGVKANSSQPDGTYSDTVTYTATVN